MAEVIGERLGELIRDRRTSQSAVADAIGVTQPTIGRLIDGTTRETGKLLELAGHLKTTPEYLVGWSDQRDLPENEEADEADRAFVRAAALAERRQGFRGAEPDDQAGMVMVKEVDLVLGFGGSYLDVPIEERMIPFPEDWLQQFSRSPVENLVFMRGRGESMKPTLLDGDICLIDLSRRRLDEQDELWALAYGDIGMIKRLRKLADGTVRVMSDNSVVPEERATDGELFIIGRCCGVFRKT